MKKLLAVMASLTVALVVQQAVALTPAEEKLANRIQPVAKVCVQGQECEGAQASAAAAPVAAGPRSGEDIYNSKCMACHNTGAAGAPKLGDVAAWEPRIAQGLETLVIHAINGINAMPAKGTCADCSDDEIHATVEFMVSKAQ